MPERGLYLLSSSFKAICNTPHPSFFRRRYRAPMNKVLFSVIFSYYLFLNWSFLPQRVPSLRSLYGSISLAMVFFISVFFSHDSNWFLILNWMICPSMDICFFYFFTVQLLWVFFFMIFWVFLRCYLPYFYVLLFSNFQISFQYRCVFFWCPFILECVCEKIIFQYFNDLVYVKLIS